MPKDFSRTLRIGEQLHRELAMLLREEIKDPRVGMVTIMDVEVSRDLSFAKVYFSTMGDDKAISECKSGLQSAAGFLRSKLGRRLNIRKIPALTFLYDDTQKQGDRIDELIKKGLNKKGYGEDLV